MRGKSCGPDDSRGCGAAGLLHCGGRLRLLARPLAARRLGAVERLELRALGKDHRGVHAWGRAAAVRTAAGSSVPATRSRAPGFRRGGARQPGRAVPGHAPQRRATHARPSRRGPWGRVDPGGAGADGPRRAAGHDRLPHQAPDARQRHRPRPRPPRAAARGRTGHVRAGPR